MGWKFDAVKGRWVKQVIADAVKIAPAQKVQVDHRQLPRCPFMPDDRWTSSSSPTAAPRQKYHRSGKKDVRKAPATVSSGARTTDADTGAKGQHGLHDDGEDVETRYYIVKPGESFLFVCLKYKISATALRKANNLSASKVKHGQRLIIPPSFKSDKKLKDLPHKQKEIESNRDVKTVDHIPSSPTLQRRPTIPTSNIEDDNKQDELSQKKQIEFSTAITKEPPPTPVIKRREEEEVQYHWVEVRYICDLVIICSDIIR